MPSVSFDRAAEYYDATRSLPPAVTESTISALVTLLRGRRVLEFGAGTGRFSVPLQRAGVALTPVDISRRMLQRGVAKEMRGAVQADAARLPFRDSSFEAALSVHVLHLISDWRQAVRELARIVRGEYVAVLDNWDRFSLHRAYREAVEATGYAYPHAEVRERDLAKFLAPRRVAVGEHRETHRLDDTLARLEARAYSSQWDVPEAIHERVMSELRARFAGQVEERVLHVEVFVWNIQALAAAVAAA
ncbi:MAG TPA: class I SAM-dependent methyltransferase [Thermoplasmata archaeon]|nr:class I SAM-dependent methyltransferase [Thermoplasmata archaeon]